MHGSHHCTIAVTGTHGNHTLPCATLGGEFTGQGSLAITILTGCQDLAVFYRNNQGNQPGVALQIHTSNPSGGAAHGTHIVLTETDCLAFRGKQHDILLAIRDRYPDQVIIPLQFNGNQATAAGPGKCRQFHFFHSAIAGSHKDKLAFLIFPQWQYRRDLFRLGEGQNIDYGPPAGLAPALGQLINLEPVHFTFIGKTENGVVGAGHHQMFNIVFVFYLGGRLAPATAALGLVGIDGLDFGVAAVGNGHHHVFFGDQIFVGQVQAGGHNLGFTLITIDFLDGLQLLNDHSHQALGIREYQ